MNRRFPFALQFSPLAASALLSAGVALLAGCESFYEGPTRTQTRSSYDQPYASTYDNRGTSGNSMQRVESTDGAQNAADRTSASTSTRSAAAGGAAAGSATRVQRDGDRTRYTMAYPTGDKDSSVMLVEKTLPSQVRLGQPFDYEIKVTNTTDATLDDVRIQEQAPEGLAITASQPERQGQGADAGWQLGTLKPRESRTIKVSGKADKQGELGTCLFASYKPSLCAAVNVVNPQIKVTKIAPQQADICDNIEYRYTVTNIGTGSTERVIVREDLPDGLTTQDGRNQVVLDAGRIEAGQTKEGVVRLKASRAGSFAGRAVATGDGGIQAQTDDVTLRVTQP